MVTTHANKLAGAHPRTD